MGNQLKKNNVAVDVYTRKTSRVNGIEYVPKTFSSKDIIIAFEKITGFKNLRQHRPLSLDDLLTRLAAPPGKKSFLVFKDHKYITIPTNNIAFFFVKYASSMMMCFDQQEYSVHYSLEQIQQLLAAGQFFRLNRQYLVNFYAIKEVEHYFACKLLVKTTISAPDKLLVSKEKVSSFLHWLENR